MTREELSEILTDLASRPLEERQRLAKEFRERCLALPPFQGKERKITLQLCDAMDEALA